MATSPVEMLRPQLKDLFRARWNILPWEIYYPWWRRPAKCRILFYTDSSVHLSGGSFQGIMYVKTLLESRAYHYVDFDVAVCNRDGSDPTATISPGTPRKLTDLDIMNKYDQIWLFGFDAGASLDAAEVSLMDQFMAAPKYGGVLTTGDHASLGKGLSGQISRVGEMRLYPAPPNSPPTWNTTLVQRGGDPISFNDQSDDVPQRIRWRRYYAGPVRARPHPVLCGPDGPIDVLPDHQHEGEALAPAVSGNSAWPSGPAGQQEPEVIAWGRISDPAATQHGQEIGVISVYNGHMAEVGRIVADSTWHHWFDINLIGINGAGPPYEGFDATLAGQAALKKIDAYFLNCGVWLAPPGVQSAMRSAALWSVIWEDIIVELPLDAPLRHWGKVGLDALGRRVSRCAVFDFVWPKEPIYKPKIPWWEWQMLPPELDFLDLPFEQYLAGGILRELSARFGIHSKRRISDGPPRDAELERAFADGAERAVESLREDLTRQNKMVSRVVEQGFSAKGMFETVKDRQPDRKAEPDGGPRPGGGRRPR